VHSRPILFSAMYHKILSYMICTIYDMSLGRDPEKLNSDLEAAIRQVCYLKEKAIISAMSAYHSRRESQAPSQG